MKEQENRKLEGVRVDSSASRQRHVTWVGPSAITPAQAFGLSCRLYVSLRGMRAK